MEMTTPNTHYQEIPAMCYTRTIDRRPYVVRVFLPNGNAETMQQKIERMLRIELENIVYETNPA